MQRLGWHLLKINRSCYKLYLYRLFLHLLGIEMIYKHRLLYVRLEYMMHLLVVNSIQSILDLKLHLGVLHLRLNLKLNCMIQQQHLHQTSLITINSRTGQLRSVM